MIIHNRIIPGEYLLGVTNEHTNHLLQRSPSPNIQSSIYSNYPFSYHQYQNNLIGSQNGNLHQSQFYNHQPELTPLIDRQHEKHQTEEEVLDLSRRCDSVETPRKTPSPYNTNSSFGSSSPNTNCGSPSTINSTNRLPSLPSQFPGIPPTGFASMYSAIQFPSIKSENLSPPLITTTRSQHKQPNDFPPPLPNNLHTMQIDARRPTIPLNPVSTSLSQISSTTPTTSVDVKPTRPFKAFPRDPLVIAANFAATDILLENRRLQRYTEFRKHALEEIRNSNGGLRTITNPKMRRTNSRSRSRSRHNSESEEKLAEESSDCDSNTGHFEKNSNNDGNNNTSSKSNEGSSHSNIKDAAYYERRRKNNAAAKKSRDRRRIKEDEIAIRAAYLERQNIELLCQLDALKAQLAAVIKANN